MSQYIRRFQNELGIDNHIGISCNQILHIQNLGHLIECLGSPIDIVVLHEQTLAFVLLAESLEVLIQFLVVIQNGYLEIFRVLPIEFHNHFQIAKTVIHIPTEMDHQANVI